MSDTLHLMFGAAAHPMRRDMLARLCEREETGARVAQNLAFSLISLISLISEPAIARHYRVLEDAGHVVRTRSLTIRPSRRRAEPLRDSAAWRLSCREC